MNFWRFHPPADLATPEWTAIPNHDLAVLAGMLALIGAYALFPTTEKIRASRTAAARWAWLVAGSFCVGIGFWGMESMALFGIQLPGSVSYDPSFGISALAPAMVGSAMAIWLLQQASPGPARIHSAALALALGLGGTHYLIMEGLVIQARLGYNFGAFALSFGEGYGLSLAALYGNTLASKRFGGRIGSRLISPLLLACAAMGVHFGAVAAAHFYPDIAIPLTHGPVAPPILIPATVLAVVLTLGFFWLGSLVDSRMGSAVEALKYSEARSRAVVETMLDAHLIADDRGIILSFNPEAQRMFGYAADEAIGMPVTALMNLASADQRDSVREKIAWGQFKVPANYRKTFADGGRRRDGSLFPVELSMTRLEVDGNSMFSCVISDLTSEWAVNTGLRRMATAVEHAADAIEILDGQGCIVYVNPAFERHRRQSLDDIRGKRPEATKALTDSEASYAEMLRVTRDQGMVWSGRMRSRMSDGRLLDEEMTVSPIRDEHKNVTAYVVVMRDVTKKILLEAQLQRAQKLESIGQLAAGIAHEINTPTQYVGDNLRFVQDSFGEINQLLCNLRALAAGTDDVTAATLAGVLKNADLEFLGEEIPKALEQSVDGCQRISTIVKAMKEFSHPGQDKTPVDLNRAIQSTITVASNEWKYLAELRTEFDTALPPVVCLPGEFNQVILNMIVNAAHAIGDVVGDGANGKGTITVTTRRDKDWAEIRIGDTGTGIRPEIRDRLFDPFFTTKEVGKGTGQGLAIAHDVVVNKHGGTITLTSDLGKGSTFIIRLPLEQSSQGAAMAA